MSEYETEEQQIEALKKWWKENWTSLIVGVAVGVSALFGWRYYTEQQNVHATQASDMYMQIIQSVTLDKVDDKTEDLNNTLINNFSDTPYAALSSMLLARSEYEKGNTDAAIAQLELAVKHATDDQTKQIANLRLASLYIENKQFTDAEAALSRPHDDAYTAQYEELKGDLYHAQGETDKARSAYDNAISLQGASASRWLKLKRQNLGEAALPGNVQSMRQGIQQTDLHNHA